MSLLLDALKKAALEKQKAKEEKQGETGPGETVDVAAGNPDEGTRENAPVQLEASGETTDDLELTLEDDATDEQPRQEEASTETGTESDPELALETPLELEKSTATTATVSDEALQMLVYKTNKQYRRKRKIIRSSILSGAVLTLVIGGVSYYYAMLQEIEALERKHALAMRTVQSQPVTRPHILQSMQEASQAKEEAVTVESQPTQNKPQKKTAGAVAKSTQTRPAKKTGSSLTIQVSEKQDPVGVLLLKAWRAYAEKDYATAEKAYLEVLNREPKNRDALLGDAAIAVKKSNYERARAAYTLLLRLDPRDPIATAGMASLNEAAPDTLEESKLKFMLQQQPDATHLHFALGNLYAKQKKWPQAQDEFFSAWQGNSDNADYAFNLAVSLDQIGKTEEARRFYESSLVNSSGQNISFSVDAVKKRLEQLAER